MAVSKDACTGIGEGLETKIKPVYLQRPSVPPKYFLLKCRFMQHSDAVKILERLDKRVFVFEVLSYEVDGLWRHKLVYPYKGT